MATKFQFVLTDKVFGKYHLYRGWYDEGDEFVTQDVIFQGVPEWVPWEILVAVAEIIAAACGGSELSVEVPLDLCARLWDALQEVRNENS